MTKIIPFRNLWQVLQAWPKTRPLFTFFSERWVVVPSKYREISFQDWIQNPWPKSTGTTEDGSPPFETGYMGVLSYDDYCGHAIASECSSRVFRIEQALIFDLVTETLRISGGDPQPSWLSELLNKCGVNPNLTRECLRLKLTSCLGQMDYCEMVAQAQEHIRNGRFYQINLLHFFDIENDLMRSEILNRMQIIGAPLASIFEFDHLRLYSMSPERFIKISPSLNGFTVDTYPIKGTSPRYHDALKDIQSRQILEASLKERSELNIIVDLLRNDLNRISKRGSVKVIDPGSLHSFPTVHHRIAHIRSELDLRLSIGQIFSRICPGGSITGAPKIEVMKAINEWENRPRNYFMGHSFYLDDRGHFDSSILIRTLVKKKDEPYQYAAGSGIVLGSHPMSEWDEIQIKCRVLTQEFTQV
jgi:para-aminobenzoate synthetase component 1